MHELAICQSVLRQVLAVATAREAGRVVRITLRIGPLAGVEPALLQSAFPIVAAGTCCARASLDIEAAAVVVHCQICGATSDATANRLLCGDCGTWRVRLLSGDQMQLASIDLFDEEPVHV
jgi:hydrogenase nickel incorporation protein HypA/HybF